jgi:AcrR family transcriptional regulator
MDLLAEVGYARLTMDQIAARARAGKASLYLRWPNKMALVAEAIQNRSAVIPDVPDTGSLPDDMRTFLRTLLRRKSEGARALAAVSREIAANPELRSVWRHSVVGNLSSCVRSIVTRAVERGELPRSTDVELLSTLPLTLLQNWRLEREQAPGDAAIERIVDQFFTPAPRRTAPAAREGRGVRH